jgi:hypothetical protein
MISLPFSMNDLQSARSDLASTMVFEISISNDRDSKITNILSDVLTDQGFSVARGGNLAVEGSVRLEPVDLDNGYENVRWYLALNMLNESGRSVVSLEENSRSSSVSAGAAEARAYKDMEKVIEDDFIDQLTAYFDSFIE